MQSGVIFHLANRGAAVQGNCLVCFLPDPRRSLPLSNPGFEVHPDKSKLPISGLRNVFKNPYKLHFVL